MDFSFDLCRINSHHSATPNFFIFNYVLGPIVRGHLHQLDVLDHDVRRALRHPHVPQLEDRKRDPLGKDQKEKDDHVSRKDLVFLYNKRLILQ